jgi:hypothetical protein
LADGAQAPFGCVCRSGQTAWTRHTISISGGAIDVHVPRIGVSGVRVNGIEIWGAHSGDSIQDSTLRGSDVATNGGVFELGSVNSSQTSMIRRRISGFRDFGVISDQRFHGLPSAVLHNVALDNRIDNIADPSTHDGTGAGGIWTGGAQAAPPRTWHATT